MLIVLLHSSKINNFVELAFYSASAKLFYKNTIQIASHQLMPLTLSEKIARIHKTNFDWWRVNIMLQAII